MIDPKLKAKERFDHYHKIMYATIAGAWTMFRIIAQNAALAENEEIIKLLINDKQKEYFEEVKKELENIK